MLYLVLVDRGVIRVVVRELSDSNQKGISKNFSSAGEFPSSRNRSKATMPACLVSSSSGPRSDAIVRVLDVFVVQACFVVCVPDSGPM